MVCMVVKKSVDMQSLSTAQQGLLPGSQPPEWGQGGLLQSSTVSLSQDAGRCTVDHLRGTHRGRPAESAVLCVSKSETCALKGLLWLQVAEVAPGPRQCPRPTQGRTVLC